MADSTNGNGNGMKTVGIIALTIAGIWVLISLIKGQWNPMKWFTTAPATPAPTDFDKCVTANKSKADGTPCANCIPTGSGDPSFNGVIVNGVCTQIRTQQAYQIQITKQPSASVYTRDAQGNFISPKIPSSIASGTVLTVIGVDKNPASYYNTSMGWISAGDASVILTRKAQ